MLESEEASQETVNYNSDPDYVKEIQYDDLGISQMVFTGFRVAGTGLIITLLVLGILSILRQ